MIEREKDDTTTISFDDILNDTFGRSLDARIYTRDLSEHFEEWEVWVRENLSAFMDILPYGRMDFELEDYMRDLFERSGGRSNDFRDANDIAREISVGHVTNDRLHRVIERLKSKDDNITLWIALVYAYHLRRIREVPEGIERVKAETIHDVKSEPIHDVNAEGYEDYTLEDARRTDDIDPLSSESSRSDREEEEISHVSILRTSVLSSFFEDQKKAEKRRISAKVTYIEAVQNFYDYRNEWNSRDIEESRARIDVYWKNLDHYSQRDLKPIHDTVFNSRGSLH
jgi:hypothetical protein